MPLGGCTHHGKEFHYHQDCGNDSGHQGNTGKNPHWIIIQRGETAPDIMPASNLAQYLMEADLAHVEIDSVNLLEIPAQRSQAAVINLRATLQETLDILNQKDMDLACIVADQHRPTAIQGVITRQDIEAHYMYR